MPVKRCTDAGCVSGVPARTSGVVAVGATASSVVGGGSMQLRSRVHGSTGLPSFISVARYTKRFLSRLPVCWPNSENEPSYW